MDHSLSARGEREIVHLDGVDALDEGQLQAIVARPGRDPEGIVPVEACPDDPDAGHHRVLARRRRVGDDRPVAQRLEPAMDDSVGQQVVPPRPRLLVDAVGLEAERGLVAGEAAAQPGVGPAADAGEPVAAELAVQHLGVAVGPDQMQAVVVVGRGDAVHHDMAVILVDDDAVAEPADEHPLQLRRGLRARPADPDAVALGGTFPDPGRAPRPFDGQVAQIRPDVHPVGVAGQLDAGPARPQVGADQGRPDRVGEHRHLVQRQGAADAVAPAAGQVDRLLRPRRLGFQDREADRRLVDLHPQGGGERIHLPGGVKGREDLRQGVAGAVADRPLVGDRHGPGAAQHADRDRVGHPGDHAVDGVAPVEHPRPRQGSGKRPVGGAHRPPPSTFR